MAMTVVRPGLGSSWASWSALALDVALALFAAAAAITLHLEVVSARGSPLTAAGLLVAALHGFSLLGRRVWPLATLGFLLITAIVYGPVLELPVFMLGPAVLISIYTVGSQLDRNRSLPALAVVEGVLVLLLITSANFPGTGSLLLFVLLIAGAWFLGDLARRWRTAAQLHQARAAELAAAREELAQRAVSKERLRIARELHDLVAHSMTVVALQAGSGRISASKDPATAQAALETIERSSREALADMRRLVGVLRQGGEEATSPAPGIGDLDRLVAEVEGAGISVDLVKAGPLEKVPAGLGLAIYRIAQEALTNVVRHSGTHQAQLTVDLSEDRLTLRVFNGPGDKDTESAAPGGGHGLSGMKERTALYGGTLITGPIPNGGYQVQASFVLERWSA